MPTLSGAHTRPGVLPDRIISPVQPSSTRLHIARDHTVPVRIGCPPLPPDATPCRGSVRIETPADVDPTPLTRSVTFSSPHGRRNVVRLPLLPSTRRMLGRNDLQAMVVITGFQGPARISKGPLPLSLK